MTDRFALGRLHCEGALGSTIGPSLELDARPTRNKFMHDHGGLYS